MITWSDACVGGGTDIVAGGSGDREEITGADTEWSGLSGSTCRSDKQGCLHLVGPDASDGEPVDTVKLAGVGHSLTADHTQSTSRAGGGIGERTVSEGSSARGEVKIVRGMSSLQRPNGSLRGSLMRLLTTDTQGTSADGTNSGNVRGKTRASKQHYRQRDALSCQKQ